MNTPTSHQKAHENSPNELIEALLVRIEWEVGTVIPPEFSRGTRNAILDELLPVSRFVLESLGIEQLQNECAIDRHVANTVSTALCIVNRILKDNQALTLADTVCAGCDGTGAWDLWDSILCETCGGTGIAAVSK